MTSIVDSLIKKASVRALADLCLMLWALSVPVVAQTWFAPPRAARPDSFVTASGWGSKPRSLPLEWRQRPDRIVIHHAGVLWQSGTDPVQKVRALQVWGQREKGWPDLPYHFLISPDGRIFEGRDPFFQPESNTNYDLRGVLNVQLFGNFEEQEVTAEQMAALSALLPYLGEEYQIPPSKISTHVAQAPGQTTCPGKNLLRHLPALYSTLRARYTDSI